MKVRWLVVAVLLCVLPTTLSARWITDRVTIHTASVGPVEFSHYNHLDAVGKNCPSCHNEIFHVVADKNPPFTMKQMEGGKSCGACHNGQRAFTVKENCATCHPAGKIVFSTDAGEAPFSHEIHLGMYGCSECHPALFLPERGKNTASMAQMEEGRSCGACHDGIVAFSVKENCDTCHQM